MSTLQNLANQDVENVQTPTSIGYLTSPLAFVLLSIRHFNRLHSSFVHAGPAAQPPYGQAAWPYGQAAPQMQPQQKPNSIFPQLGIGVAVGLISGAAQAGIGALFSG